MWAAWTLAAGLTAALVVMLAVWLSARGRALGEREAARRLLSDYRTLLQDLGAVVWEFDLASERVTFVSDSARQVLGYDPDDWRRIERGWLEKTHPDDRDRVVEALRALQQDAGPRRMEMRMLAADGRVVWLDTALIAYRGRSGERKVRGVTFDTSAHKHTEQKLRRLLSLYSATVESTADGILVVDLEGKITSANRKFGEMWHLPAEVLLSGEDDRALAVALDQLVDPEGFLSKVRELYASEAASFDVLQFKDGRVFERYSQPQRIDGACVGRVWSFRDVTERARAERALRASEEQLRQAHKMEAVGRLAGGVAHDFNNILTAILGNLGLLLDDARTPAVARQRMEDIEQAAERAANLTRQLLAFSRKQMFELQVVDLNQVLADMQSLLMPILGENVELEIRCSPQTCLVRVDRSQIEQVVLNLAINGRDALPQGGRLDVATSVHERESPGELEAGSESRRWVTLTVADNGVGMDEDTRLHLFEPFFTTKERGKGTGLGLATVYGIVRQSGGQIRVHSEPGRGSTFHIDLPCVDGPQRDPREDAPVPKAALEGTETVLVTEDEDQVLRLMSATLRRFGYHVLEAHRGVHAISAAAAFPGTIHLLVTDVVMPGMGGRELAERLTAVRPDLRVLYVSGYTDDAIVLQGVVDPKVAFLQKPFTMVALARKVRETLDAPSPAK